MHKRVTITKLSIHNHCLELIVENDEMINWESTIPSGKMLVDSDQLSFIYILEAEEQFIYVSLPISIWEELKIVVDNEDHQVVVKAGNRNIALTGFVSELTYLIENIKGNANYGDAMVSKVEEVF